MKSRYDILPTIYNILVWFLTGFIGGLELGKSFKEASIYGAGLTLASMTGLHQKRPNSPLRPRKSSEDRIPTRRLR